MAARVLREDASGLPVLRSDASGAPPRRPLRARSPGEEFRGLFDSPDRPLDPETRGEMEARLGYDLGAVQVHTGGHAAASAQRLGARAFTSGSHVAFAAGEYAPRTGRGRFLLAHELAHVVQQTRQPGPPLLAGAWNICVSAESCPESGQIQAPLAAHEMQSPVPGYIVYPFAVGSSDASSLRADPTWAAIQRTLENASERWDILGFTDCAGSDRGNAALRQARAGAVNGELTALARTKINNVRAPAMGDCVSEEISPEDRLLNRSAVLVAVVGPITSPACPPAAPIRAASISDYLPLVLCVENLFPAYSPREILSLLRQFYYGSPRWSAHPAAQWDQIITCGLSLPDPRPVMGAVLVDSLTDSQEVAGVDIGHVFAGLEAMVCPEVSVTPRINPPRMPEITPDVPTIEVEMPNEFLATWGGDIGAAAEERANVAIQGRTVPPWSCYIGGPAGGNCPSGSLQASSADLQGDVDAFAIRAGLAGRSCAATELQPLPSLTSPISQMLLDYYNAEPISAGSRRNDHIRCFLQMLGASLTSERIVNKTDVVERIFPWVHSFASASRMGRTRSPNIEAGDAAIIEQYSREACAVFVDWLEARL